MPRSDTFHPFYEPLRHHASINPSPNHTTGPLSFLNPTRAQFIHEAPPASTPASNSDSTPKDAPPARLNWRSRDNRKGRHALLIPPPSSSPSSTHPSDNLSTSPRPTSSPTHILHRLTSMATTCPYWDISYLVALIFTLGSLIWVVNAFFVWLPLVDPGTEFAGEISTGGGWTAFVGATVFEIGSVLLMLEAVNENREGCFGWAVEAVVGGWRVDRGGEGEACGHHQSNRGNLVGRGGGGGKEDGKEGVEGKNGTEESGSAEKSRAWQWWPSWKDLSTHYIYSLGFLACLAQLFGASVFWISGFTALPQIYDRLATQTALDGAYWAPQIIGGCGFIVSGLLFMLETQERWYKPAYGTLGWWIGLWNLIGAFGFTLCGALGPAYASSGAQFEASLATFWGSWAFLVGSVVQWYESLEKFPVEVDKEAGKRQGQEQGKEV
ncbi:MAG: hypothetical protein MMC23_001132 [Stictis urceolatum]|nr:hypothetical protein [Stictis urceolata]